jgi:2-oxoacid:acceptor oxidoreductase gamma subunit (pyruvate/2-ketoisovalerate family)
MAGGRASLRLLSLSLPQGIRLHMIEIRIHGRGGQGAVVASKILAIAFFKEGKYVQSFPAFGVERRGAPVAAFIRTGQEFIYLRSEIYQPDHVIVLDPTLIGPIAVTGGLKEGGWLLINSEKEPNQYHVLNPSRHYRIATVNANHIARQHHLGSPTNPIVNTAIVGAFARISNLVSIDSVEAAIREEVPIEKEENAKAARDAYIGILGSGLEIPH